MTELHELDAHGQADALRSGDVSAAQLVEHHLSRIGDDPYGAFITVTADRALEQARVIDQARSAGAELPPFAGVPTAFKDLTMTAGVRTTFGSALMTENIPPLSAHSVTQIEAAGFISLGKTNTPEFGLSSYTDNDLVGPARCPADPTRTAGGSSGGAAAAVAAGYVPLAPGSDGGGSIRIPASCCGVIGFKPSRGRISSGPMMSDWSGLATEGTLTTTVRDAAALLDILVRPMPGDTKPISTPRASFASLAQQPPKRLRIARWSDPYLPGISTHPDCIAAWNKTSALLESLGHELIDIDNPFPAELEPQFNVVWSTGIATVPIPSDAESLLRPNTRYWRKRGGDTSGTELAQALAFLDLTSRDVLTRLGEFDVFLTPTLAMPPQPVEWFNESGDPATDHARELEFTPFTAVYNMSGCPAISMPVHTNDEGLPIGVMFAARPGADELLVSLAAQLEGAR